VRRGLLIVLLAGAGCLPDFDLDARRFLCEPASGAGCRPGETCTAEGQCLPPDAGLHPDAGGVEICGNEIDDDGDLLVDCKDPECGEASCNDDNPCTIDSCGEDGICSRVPDDAMTGGGWICSGGRQVETSCNDFLDNEEDGLRDCLDPDCPRCQSILNCCRGVCLPTCY
jgi:hypothetical protein